jgi:PD-(D/E)XK nuclease superfamily
LSDLWFFTLRKFEEDIEKKNEAGAGIDYQAIMKQFRFWFDRARYDSHTRVPKRDVVEVYEYLEKWALETFTSNAKHKSLLTLSEQARKIKELLDELPETALSRLELDRIVKTIYRPSPVTIYEREVGALPYIHQSGALAAQPEATVWWNFTDHSPQQVLSLWKKEELAYFAAQEVFIEGVEKKNALHLAHQKRPLFFTQKQLILIIPEQTDGKETLEHPLMGYLHSLFESVKSITYNIDAPPSVSFEPLIFPEKKSISLNELPKAQPFIQVKDFNRKKRERESLTSLEDLIYYPHKWALKYQAGFFPSSILSIAKDSRLMGNLAHRCFELMFKESQISTWQKSDVERWVEENSPKLLRQEGAVLLMYGKEQERERFISTLKYSAWNLISMLNNNGWVVKGSEMSLAGDFGTTKIKGIADLVLQRGEETAILDLKWSGLTTRSDLIRNQEDLQLVMYAHLLGLDNTHTAYYIIENGQLLVRNKIAFKEGKLVPKQEESHKEINAMIFEKMLKTYDWRAEQLAKGNIEVRTETTIPTLDSEYGATLMDLLEMKRVDSRFDDYRVLIGAIE